MLKIAVSTWVVALYNYFDLFKGSSLMSRNFHLLVELWSLAACVSLSI